MDLFPLIYLLAVIIAVLMLMVAARGIEAKDGADDRAVLRSTPDMPPAEHGDERA